MLRETNNHSAQYNMNPKLYCLEEMSCYFILNKVVQIVTSALKGVKMEWQFGVQNQVQICLSSYI
jgi:hypothetical protein